MANKLRFFSSRTEAQALSETTKDASESAAQADKNSLCFSSDKNSIVFGGRAVKGIEDAEREYIKENVMQLAKDLLTIDIKLRKKTATSSEVVTFMCADEGINDDTYWWEIILKYDGEPLTNDEGTPHIVIPELWEHQGAGIYKQKIYKTSILESVEGGYFQYKVPNEQTAIVNVALRQGYKYYDILKTANISKSVKYGKYKVVKPVRYCYVDAQYINNDYTVEELLSKIFEDDGTTIKYASDKLYNNVSLSGESLPAASSEVYLVAISSNVVSYQEMGNNAINFINSSSYLTDKVELEDDIMIKGYKLYVSKGSIAQGSKFNGVLTINV